MRVIDIACWQDGLMPEAVDCDAIIVKVTQGTWYINDPSNNKRYNLKADWRDWAERILNCGKRLGLYHYAEGTNVYEEADFFLYTVRDYIGEAVLALDWEEGENQRWEYHNLWSQPWLAHTRKKTGLTPWLYVQQSAMHLNNTGFPLWVAQYASDEPTGWQSNPWNEGAYDCVMRQYSSHGRILGYGGDLDINKAYITPEQWDEYAGKKKIETEVSDMVFSFQPEGENTAYIYENGIVYALDQLDELKAWRMAHKAATGKELPHINDIDSSWCAKESPYWKRFADSLGHKVTLKGFGK